MCEEQAQTSDSDGGCSLVITVMGVSHFLFHGRPICCWSLLRVRPNNLAMALPGMNGITRKITLS